MSKKVPLCGERKCHDGTDEVKRWWQFSKANRSQQDGGAYISAEGRSEVEENTQKRQDCDPPHPHQDGAQSTAW